MDFTQAVREALQPLTEDIAALCKIKSVEGDPKPGMPFGEGPAQALEAALVMGERMGFKTENFDNYVGHIEYGEGEEIVGILGHVDVVPAGDGWETDPWGSVIRDGKLWGRGVLDDKGPVLTCLYAMKILKDLGVPLKKRIRLILGTNEENNWGCMDYYLREVKPQLPDLAFSPDAEFPVTYAEMGMLQFTLERPVTEDICLKGGSAFNSVPSSARAVLPAELEEDVRAAVVKSANQSMYTVENTDEGVVLHVKGIGAHAACPKDGKNAISYMMELLSELPVTGELKEIVEFYRRYFGTSLFGENMGIAVSDADCGPLTLNVGKISVEGRKLTICCDSRIPVSVEVNQIAEKIRTAVADSGYDFHVTSKEDPLYIPKDSYLVTTLMEAYQKVTGDMESQPMASGGATYSRTIGNCVAFGCLLPDQEDTMHQANEYLELSKLEIWLKICLEAIYQLARE